MTDQAVNPEIANSAWIKPKPARRPARVIREDGYFSASSFQCPRKIERMKSSMNEDTDSQRHRYNCSEIVDSI